MPAARAAARALTLYAAQTRPARLARALLQAALRCGIPMPLVRIDRGCSVTDRDPQAAIDRDIQMGRDVVVSGARGEL